MSEDSGRFNLKDDSIHDCFFSQQEGMSIPYWL